MDETIKTVKQLPFKQINPSKYMGINNQLPFNSIISQSKLLYFSGRSIILQIIKTHQQKIIWTNEYEYQPQVIEHIKNAQRQNILGIVIRDNSQNHLIFILHINSIINNYEHLDTKEKSKDRVHYLKNLDHNDQVVKLKFLQDAAMFATVVKQKNTQNQFSNKNVYIYKSLTGDCLYSCDFMAKDPLIQSVLLNRQSYVCIIRNQPETEKQIPFLKLQNSFVRPKSNLNEQEGLKLNFIINLLNLHDLQNKRQLSIELEEGQSIVQVNFVENHKKMIAYFLLDSGFIFSYVLNQRGFYQKLRIDVRISLIEHEKKIQEKMNSNNSAQKIQPCKEEFASNNKLQQGHFQQENEQKQTHQSFIEGKNIQNVLKNNNQKEDKACYYLPNCISCISNKIVIGYEKCSFIGVIQYSGVDHHQYKYWYIDDFFIKKPQIDSIRKISFAEDGCHCCVLVKVINAGKLVSNDSLKPKSYLLERNQQFLLPQRFNLLQIDIVSGMIQHSYHSQSIEQSLTCCSLNGDVECVEFVFKNNTMFVLIGDGRLCYCAMSIEQLDDNYANRKNDNFINNGNKKNDAKKQPSNNILSKSMLLWWEHARTKPYLILSHPIVFQVVLVYQDCIKFHFFNNQKLFQYHHSLNLKNCKAASYSPYGDKLALGTPGSIWVMDSYTYAVVKKIPLVIFPTEVINKPSESKTQKKHTRRTPSVLTSHSTKSVSKIQYINNNDIMIQTGNTTLSILLDYQKVLYFGYTSQIIQGHLFCYDNKHHLGVIASQDCVKVIAKCSINSKNKCQQMAKIEIVITAIKLCGQIDVLFLGGKNGVLYFLRWPEFFQNEALKYPTLKNKLYLFHCAIVDIQIPVNYKKLFVTSEQGMIIICDLVHSDDAQKIGKDVYYRISKKIDLKLPLLNKWLASSSETECHARYLTKMMGNEAQIKINQNTFTEQYKLKLQTQLKEKTEKLNQEFKRQLKKYEIESGITKLQLNIALASDQIKSIIGKRQAQSKILNEKIERDLHKVFKQKQKLQKEFNELKKKCQQEKQIFLKNLQQKIDQTDQKRQSQSKQMKTIQNESLDFYSQKMKMGFDLQQNMKQDFQEDLSQAQLFYGGQFKQILQKNNYLSQQNRRMKIQMIQTSQKMKEFSTRMEQLQSDVKEIQKQGQQLNQTKIQFSQQLIETDTKYHQLIKLTKQLQTKLNKTRTSSQACQMRFDQLEKDMAILQQKWNYLEEKAQQNGNDFVEQHNFRNIGQNQQQQLKLRIVKLKNKRKQLFQRQVLLKDLLKPFQKQVQQSQGQNLQNFNKNKSLQHKKTKAVKLTSDVDKWSNLKDQSKVKMIKNNQKLQQQTSKLIFRLNQMTKQHKQLVNRENNLKSAIKLQKQKLNSSLIKNSWEKFTFVTVPEEKQQTDTVNYRSYLPINRKSLTKQNKFNSTYSHFSSSNSLNKQKNVNRLSQKTYVFLKQKGQNVNNSDLSSSKLNKVTSKNLQSLINQKKTTFKQLKKQTSNSSLYHGVTLDPKTLKPNKTLCISLHKQGTQTKFVTEY